MEEQSRLAFLAANYSDMRGLRFAPFWALMVALPWIERTSWDATAASGLAWLTAWVSVCIVWYWRLNVYYAGHFGRVEKKPVKLQSPVVILVTLLVVALVVRVLWTNPAVATRNPGIFLFLIPLNMLRNAFAPHNVAIRRFSYLAGGILLISVLLPALVGRGNSSFHWIQFSIFGAVTLALDLLDHLLLLRTFPPNLQETNA